MEWLLDYGVKVRHPFVFDAVSLLQRDMHLIEEVDAGSCIKVTFGSAHTYIASAIAEVELIRPL